MDEKYSTLDYLVPIEHGGTTHFVEGGSPQWSKALPVQRYEMEGGKYTSVLFVVPKRLHRKLRGKLAISFVVRTNEKGDVVEASATIPEVQLTSH